MLPTGPLPPDAGEFMESRVVAEILAELKTRADLVLIDAPPLLHVGDAMALTAKIDAVVLVARLNVLRRPMVTESVIGRFDLAVGVGCRCRLPAEIVLRTARLRRSICSAVVTSTNSATGVILCDSFPIAHPMRMPPLTFRTSPVM